MASSRAPKFRSHRDVFRLWENNAQLAQAIGEKYPTVAAMWRRGRLSPRVWGKVAEAAKRDKKVHLGVQTLCELYGR